MTPNTATIEERRKQGGGKNIKKFNAWFSF
jgi:hypothetical protein